MSPYAARCNANEYILLQTELNSKIITKEMKVKSKFGLATHVALESDRNQQNIGLKKA